MMDIPLCETTRCCQELSHSGTQWMHHVIAPYTYIIDEKCCDNQCLILAIAFNFRKRFCNISSNKNQGLSSYSDFSVVTLQLGYSRQQRELVSNYLSGKWQCVQLRIAIQLTKWQHQFKWVSWGSTIINHLHFSIYTLAIYSYSYCSITAGVYGACHVY